MPLYSAGAHQNPDQTVPHDYNLKLPETPRNVILSSLPENGNQHMKGKYRSYVSVAIGGIVCLKVFGFLFFAHETAPQNKKPARSSSNSDNKIQMREPVKRTNTGKALRRNEIAKKENGAVSASPADRMQNGRKRHSHSSNAGQQSTSSAVKAQDKPGIHAQKELSGDAKLPRIAQRRNEQVRRQQEQERTDTRMRGGRGMKAREKETEQRLIDMFHRSKEVSSCGEGVFTFRDHGGRRNGLVCPEEHVILESSWRVAGDFHQGLAPVEERNHFGYINRIGEIVIPIVWDSATDYLHGKATASRRGKTVFLDLAGNVKVVEDILRAVILVHYLLLTRGNHCDIAAHLVEGGLVVYIDIGEVIVQKVADEGRHAAVLAEEQLDFLGLCQLLPATLPLAYQALELRIQYGGPLAFGGGADNGAVVLGQDAVDQAAKACLLFFGRYLLGDAHLF